MSERQTITLPVWGAADPGSAEMRFRVEIFHMLMREAPILGGDRVLDTPALARACLDTLAWIYAHGDQATDRRKARAFGREQGAALAERMLRWRQDFEAGRLKPVSLVPTKARKH